MTLKQLRQCEHALTTRGIFSSRRKLFTLRSIRTSHITLPPSRWSRDFLQVKRFRDSEDLVRV